MICTKIGLPSGAFAIVCGSRPPAPRCAFCNARSTRLCDGERARTLGGGVITCDLPICDAHRQHVDPDLDYCPRHGTGSFIEKGAL